ncbi:MAG: hypothetical protein ACFFB3_12370 [Candidatus Hodarchaeota archaeon]
MSIDSSKNTSTPCRKLYEYIWELIKRLGENDPDSFRRMCEIVGNRKARIVVDNETAIFSLDAEGLTFYDDRGDIEVNGEGRTNRCTVLDLLDGYIEVSEAISDGSLQVIGEPDNVFRMFLSIEILLDCSASIPALQELARDYRNDPCLDTIEEIVASGNSRRAPAMRARIKFERI